MHFAPRGLSCNTLPPPPWFPLLTLHPLSSVKHTGSVEAQRFGSVAEVAIPFKKNTITNNPFFFSFTPTITFISPFIHFINNNNKGCYFLKIHHFYQHFLFTNPIHSLT
ncbi:hypothetical protein RIF29_00073 [Crotalaria pallida]|uniref:Uncharacterized protein n=1 Tax=Crotalaria pallida TaxID=3830 RepID=A0AAN9IWA3_CROPI